MTVIEYAKSKTILEHAFNQNLIIPKSLWVKSNTFPSPFGGKKVNCGWFFLSPHNVCPPAHYACPPAHDVCPQIQITNTGRSE